jgi:hypothetical protein
MASGPLASLEELRDSMSWDKELEDLAVRVCDVFGGRALALAWVRVLQQAPELPTPLLDVDLDGLVPLDSDAKFVDGADSAAALKAELQTLLRPH